MTKPADRQHEDLFTRVAEEQSRPREVCSSEELERQIASLLIERLAKSRDKARALALARRGQEVTVPRDVLKDPFVLEFLDLPGRHPRLECDLEQAIIDRIEAEGVVRLAATTRDSGGGRA